MKPLASTVASFYWQLAGSIHRDIPLNDEGKPEEFNRYVGYFLDEQKAFQGQLREPLRKMAEATSLEAIASNCEPRSYLRLAGRRASAVARRTSWSRLLRSRPMLVPTEAYLVADAALIVGILRNALIQIRDPLAVLTAGIVIYGAWFIADMASYMIHVNSDGWGDSMGSRVFQDHHTHEDEAARWTWLRAIDTTAPKVLPLMFLLAISRPHFTVAISAILFLQGLLITPKIHGMAHQRDLHGWFSALQKCRLILSPAEHARHHRQLDRGFAGLNGWSNSVMDRVGYPELHATVRMRMGSRPPKWTQENADVLKRQVVREPRVQL
jgi:Lipid desaturase domain